MGKVLRRTFLTGFVLLVLLWTNPLAQAASSFTFTDDPLTSQVTLVKVVHITELRQAINTLRSRNGLSAFAFTDPTLTPGVTPIKAVHITELRTALNAIFDALGQTHPTYIDPTVVAGQMIIKSVHISELRSAVGVVDVFTLTLNIAGTGSGTVTTSPAGINCGATCGATFAPGTSVTLTATPAANSTFAGFSGDTDCSDGVVTMNGNISCTATFNIAQFTLTVNKVGAGSGTVTSSPAGIFCGTICSASFNSGTSVTLTATAAGGSVFAGWSVGSCSGTGSCAVTMNANTTVTATFNQSGTGLLLGAIDFPGPYPEPADVTFTDSTGQQVQVLAYPGQIQVFFDPATSEADAVSAVQSRGGTILAQIPAVGYYLVDVTSGQEGLFISGIGTDSRVNYVVPHVVASLASAGTILDGCSVSHSETVTDVFIAEGGTFDECREILEVSSVNSHRVNTEIVTEANQNGTGPTLLNLSAAGQFNPAVCGSDYLIASSACQTAAQQGWLSFMRTTLFTIVALPQTVRDNLVITIAAGNINMPIDPLIATLRGDPRLANVLKNNVLIVTTNQFTGSNDTASGLAGDADVAVLTNPLSSQGTSFAAPAALARIQLVMLATGATPKEALQAAKLAVATNANHQLITSEAIDKAQAILTAQGTDPPGSASVTAISFTSVGSVTAAVITPAIAGVTVQFTVSGTDGFFDSGSLPTDASGRVSFSIPPGAPGVIDTISVLAVLSGRLARTTFTWP